MDKIKLYLFLSVAPMMLSGCAKFDLLIRDFSSTAPPPPVFGLDTPITNQVFFKDNQVVITGVCDPLGSDVELTSELFATPATTTCNADGEYSHSTPIPPALVSSRDPFDIVATQDDGDGNPMNDTAVNLRIHCSEDTTSELATCTLGGTGNFLSDPYLVPNIACLQEMRDGLNCHYRLTNDIDAASTSTWNAGAGFEPVPLNATPTSYFSGSLDGAGYTISNLNIKQRNDSGTGIFSSIVGLSKNDGQTFVKNLTIKDSVLEGITNIGFITGNILQSTISEINIEDSSVISSAAAKGHRIGGLIGYLNNSDLLDTTTNNLELVLSSTSAAPGPTAEMADVGGLVGHVFRGSIFQGNVNLKVRNGSLANETNLYYDNIGGLTGYIAQSTVQDFTATTEVTVSSTATTVKSPTSIGVGNIGGVHGMLAQSYSLRICSNANVNIESTPGAGSIGGYYGFSYESSVKEGTNLGSFNASTRSPSLLVNVGGLGGYHSKSYLWDFFSGTNTYIDSRELYHVGGLIGKIEDPPAGIPTVRSVLRFGPFGLNTPTLPTDSVGGLVGAYTTGAEALGVVLNTTPVQTPYPAIGQIPTPATFLQYTTSPESGLKDLLDWDHYGIGIPNVYWERNPVTGIPYSRYCP